ncbi:hypothetical protein pipiens_012475 [Culex pipiens pipiens]|uniref:Uncharacterized protein n=1 Tax=Culex pipiens pipiens TaxID=38569 RepID=A0ABD1D262_CULPP
MKTASPSEERRDVNADDTQKQTDDDGKKRESSNLSDHQIHYKTSQLNLKSGNSNLQQLTANTLYSTSDWTVLHQPPDSVIIPAVPETVVGDSMRTGYDFANSDGVGNCQEEYDEAPEAESIVPEEEVPAVGDHYGVEPLKLPEIWNDLITANQEILILHELQDLKHYIVDARKIEDQLVAMTFDYCPKELPDVGTWNLHIKKIQSYRPL